MISRFALSGIGFYQTHLSPRKGYRCAYSVLHGGTGCSGYVKHAIRDHGLWSALRLCRARMAACKDAADELNKDRAKRKKTKRDGWAYYCGVSLCAAAPCSSGGQTPSSTPPDVADSGCTAPDCAPDCTPSCDFCSCGG
ncbi:MAG: membrane protein insertion efficiency factor YidD [Sedimentitalea sp.]